METVDAEMFARRTGIQESDFGVLKKLALFSELPDNDVRSLLQHSVVRSYPGNTVFFLQGDPGEQFYILFDGWVKLFRETEGGHESVIQVIAKGESFAEAAIFDRSTFPVSASAVGDVRMMVVPAGPFLSRLKENGDLALNILGAMARRNRQLVHKLEQLTVKSSAERVAMFLMDLCKAKEGACEIRLPHDKSLVAARLGMQPETLSRSLAKLRNIGVETKAEKVLIGDVLTLKQFSKGEMS